MGGAIGVASREGAGSRFHFDLPLESAATPPKALHSTAATRRFDGMRILIAEDNAVNQRLLSQMLERRGCLTDIASNGAQAIVMASARDYALILMDGQMPEMDGFEAKRRLRQLLGDSAPLVIAVTARAMEHDRRQCFDAGMSDHLAKHVGSAALSAILEKWLGAALRPITTEPQFTEAPPAS